MKRAIGEELAIVTISNDIRLLTHAADICCKDSTAGNQSMTSTRQPEMPPGLIHVE